jgi:hypothetical protein
VKTLGLKTISSLQPEASLAADASSLTSSVFSSFAKSCRKYNILTMLNKTTNQITIAQAIFFSEATERKKKNHAKIAVITNNTKITEQGTRYLEPMLHCPRFKPKVILLQRMYLRRDTKNLSYIFTNSKKIFHITDVILLKCQRTDKIKELCFKKHNLVKYKHKLFL